MRFFKHIIRLFHIGLVLMRYRALFPLEKAPLAKPIFWVLSLFPPYGKNKPEGQRLAEALEVLGPSFIKLGQTLSTRPDVIGEAIANDLASLRDDIAPFDSDVAFATIEKELGASISELFRHVEEKPIAAASIAQVHVATTREGKKVAVKVLRPEIERKFAKDIDFFMWVARWQQRLVPSLRRLKPVEVVKMLAESVKMEMDLRFEAAAASELKQNTSKDKYIYVPDVYWQLTSQRVLTTEWIDGISIHDHDALVAAGHDPRELSARLAVSFFNQAYRDGFFHADMHPGNVFVDKDGNISPVDFGIMGRLAQKDRLAVAQILKGFLDRDYMQVAKVHIDVGYVPASTSPEHFAQACRSIGEPIIGLPVNKISIARLLSQLFKITEDFAMETQPQLLLLQKTMVLVEGIGQTLDPNVNMWKLAEPWIKQWAIDQMGVEAKLRDTVRQTVFALQQVPEIIARAEHVAESVSRDGFRLHPDTVKAMVAERKESVPALWKIAALSAAIAFAVSIWIK